MMQVLVIDRSPRRSAQHSPCQPVANRQPVANAREPSQHLAFCQIRQALYGSNMDDGAAKSECERTHHGTEVDNRFWGWFSSHCLNIATCKPANPPKILRSWRCIPFRLSYSGIARANSMPGGLSHDEVASSFAGSPTDVGDKRCTKA